MSLQYDRVRFKNNFYAIMRLKYKKEELPILIDWIDLNIIKRLNKRWKYNKYGFVLCTHTFNDKTKDVFLHEIIMALKYKDQSKPTQTKPILHINRVGLDNRRDNLIYDNKDKDHNKNIKKKKRTITFPQSSGITPDEIPTYVWYMKANGSHGERFMVDVKGIKWKTTSSKKLSLRYKLEEAKAFLRQLRDDKPHLFEEYSMNGDYTKKGEELLSSYYSIVQKAGYDNINIVMPTNKTTEYLKAGAQTRKEQLLLRQQGNLIRKRSQNRRIISNLPPRCGINIVDIPKYCHYRPVYKGRGDYFVVVNHPNQKERVWQTTTSKKVSIQDKFQELLDHLDTLAEPKESEEFGKLTESSNEYSIST